MTKASNIKSIEDKTGKKWAEWVKILESFNAKDLPHPDIVKKLEELTDLDGWWRQNITVTYEQHIGRRVPGQRADGTFEVSVTKTVEGSMDATYEAWLKLVDGIAEFNSVKLKESPKTSETEKWRNWRANLDGGTKMVVGINQKDEGKALLGLAHQKLPNAETAEQWRAYWRQFVQNLA